MEFGLHRSLLRRKTFCIFSSGGVFTPGDMDMKKAPEFSLRVRGVISRKVVEPE
jgi:hypothetical protein